MSTANCAPWWIERPAATTSISLSSVAGTCTFHVPQFDIAGDCRACLSAHSGQRSLCWHSASFSTCQTVGKRPGVFQKYRSGRHTRTWPRLRSVGAATCPIQVSGTATAALETLDLWANRGEPLRNLGLSVTSSEPGRLGMIWQALRSPESGVRKRKTRRYCQPCSHSPGSAVRGGGGLAPALNSCQLGLPTKPSRSKIPLAVCNSRRHPSGSPIKCARISSVAAGRRSLNIGKASAHDAQ